MILPRGFYGRAATEVARELLGKILVHGETAGKIVETEAYLGGDDLASHSARGITDRTRVIFGPPGHAYVYFIYGLYYCFNITTGNEPGKPEAVLLRAIEPVAGESIMAKRRGANTGKIANLTNGPSKLCMAMGITKEQNKFDLTASPLYIEEASPILPQDIVETTRIGVDYAGEWKNNCWRFYVKGNNFVSAK